MTKKLTNGYNIQALMNGMFNVVHCTSEVKEKGVVKIARSIILIKGGFRTFAGAKAYKEELENENK